MHFFTHKFKVSLNPNYLQSDGYWTFNDGRKARQYIRFDSYRSDDKRLLSVDVSDAHIFIDYKRIFGFYHSEHKEQNPLNEMSRSYFYVKVKRLCVSKDFDFIVRFYRFYDSALFYSQRRIVSSKRTNQINIHSHTGKN